MNTIKFFAIHHTGGLYGQPHASTQNHTLEQINNAHKSRWPNFPSELNPQWFVGYNALYFPDGKRIQTRLIGEETAAQIGHNLDSFAGCLLGNFTQGVDAPTWQQKNTLRRDLLALLENRPESVGLKVKPGTQIDITVNRIVPHRYLQPNTECFGSGLRDDFGRNLVSEYITILSQLLIHLQTLLGLLKRHKIGGVGRACSGFIN